MPHSTASITSTDDVIVQEILEVEQIMDEQTGLDLTEDNVETVLDEIRPYLIGTFSIPNSFWDGLQGI